MDVLFWQRVHWFDIGVLQSSRFKKFLKIQWESPVMQSFSSRFTHFELINVLTKSVLAKILYRVPFIGKPYILLLVILLSFQNNYQQNTYSICKIQFSLRYDVIFFLHFLLNLKLHFHLKIS